MKICIIGGRGQMGRLFEKIFLSKGHSVVIQGRQVYDKLEEDVKGSDIVIVSVPLDKAAGVVSDVAEFVDEDKLVVDFSSIMKPDVGAMKKLKCQSAFIHPLFGANISSLKNLNTIVVPLVKGSKLDWFVEFLKEEDVNVSFSTVEEHDNTMAIAIGLNHFNNLAYAKTLSKHGVKDEFDTISFGLKKKLISRLLDSEPHVSANIAFMNEGVVKIIEEHKKDIDELYEIIKNKDMKGFEGLFGQIAKKLATKENKKLKIKKPVHNWDKDATAVLGPRGSFTDAACTDEKKVYVDTITEVLEAVRDGKVLKGVVPIENSVEGTVNEALDGINYMGLCIVKAIVKPIHHCCAGLGGDYVLSHPQALGQCSKFISQKYPDAKIVHTLSTAEAFQRVQEKQISGVAIGPLIAANVYGLPVLHENVEDSVNNKTKFVVVSKELGEGNVTSIVVQPFHEKQGVLFNLMKFFNDDKINLTKIESRPVRDKLGVYLFYIDFDGNAKSCLDKIKKEVGDVKVLGCYNVE